MSLQIFLLLSLVSDNPLAIILRIVDKLRLSIRVDG